MAGEPPSADLNRERIAELAAPIRRYLVAMLGDEHAAEDLTQETLQRAWSRRAELADPHALRSWVFAIAIHACRSHLRRAWNRRREPEQPDALREAQDPARTSVLSSIVRRESAAALALAIDRLPVLLREAFVLHHVERLSYEEIAAMTDVRVNTLQVRAHRARALLRRQLGDAVDPAWPRAPHDEP